MADDAFKPKLGRIRDTKRNSAVSFARRVIKEAARNAGHRKGRVDPNALRRGLASGVVAASGSFAPGTRRVVVRARYSRYINGDLGAARAHLRYILRDGTTRDGAPGRLYEASGDHVDAQAFLDRSVSDPHQFRFIVSIEDSQHIADLKPIIRDLMRQMEHDLGTKLDWVAVDHFNTGHPHTHVVLRGKDERNQDLIIARDYIAYGIRSRAQDLVTLELGPETELERLAKRDTEIGHERLTSLDRTLLKRSAENVLVVSAAPRDDTVRHTQLVGRLKKLESLGLAKEQRTGVWALDPELEPKLRRLGERVDKIKMMQRALAEVGLERPTGTLAVFDRGTRKEALLGKVVGTGLVDEISDRSWIIVDGADGRVHYIELGRLRPDSVPPRAAIVRVVADRLDGKPQSMPRIDILVRQPQREDVVYDGPVWIDRLVVAGAPGAQQYRGFGQELADTIAARRTWLVEQDLGRHTTDARFEVRHSLVTSLRQREMARLGQALEQETGMKHVVVLQGATVRGRVGRTIEGRQGAYVAISNGAEVRLVPWTRALERHRGQEIAGTLGVKQLILGRQRGLER